MKYSGKLSLNTASNILLDLQNSFLELGFLFTILKILNLYLVLRVDI